MTCYLYKHYGKDGELLYVGMTENYYVRQAHHSKNSEWFVRSVKVIISSFETRLLAKDAESFSIINEKPLHNKRETKGLNKYKTSKIALVKNNKSETKKIIDAFGGCQSVANILNECGLKVHTRQRIFNWYKSDKIPAWAQLAYKNVWNKGLRLSKDMKK